MNLNVSTSFHAKLLVIKFFFPTVSEFTMILLMYFSDLVTTFFGHRPFTDADTNLMIYNLLKKNVNNILSSPPDIIVCIVLVYILKKPSIFFI